MTNKTPPNPVSDLPILQKAADAYICWHKNVANLSRFTRATLGIKIDTYFTEIIALLVRAEFAHSQGKVQILNTASQELDALKYFLHLAHRCDELGVGKYIEISALLLEVGKMLGGWRKQLSKTANASSS